MDLSRYNKLIAVVVGNAVGFALVWLATKTPMAECAVVAAKTTCTLLGLSQGELTGVVMALITSLAVAVGPKNSLTDDEAVKEAASREHLVKKVELQNTVQGRALNNETPENVTVARSH